MKKLTLLLAISLIAHCLLLAQAPHDWTATKGGYHPGPTYDHYPETQSRHMPELLRFFSVTAIHLK